MTVLTRELTDLITRLDEAKQRRLLEFAQHLFNEPALTEPSYNAPDWWAMPYEERNRAVGVTSARSLEDDIAFDDEGSA